jgi:uncharacterized protein YegL
MFRKLRSQIETDVPLLANKGIKVLRPVAFLLTDANPTDRAEWRGALAELTDIPVEVEGYRAIPRGFVEM